MHPPYRSRLIQQSPVIGHWTDLEPRPDKAVFALVDEFSESVVDNGTREGYFRVDRNGRQRTVATSVLAYNQLRQLVYEGGIVADWPPAPDQVHRGYEDLGPEAFRRAKESLVGPVMNGLNALYELKDVPGMLSDLRNVPSNIKKRFEEGGRPLKDIGNISLAIQFGWLPLAGDVSNMLHFRPLADRRVKQIRRDNGRPVRRRFKLRSDGMSTDGPRINYPLANPTFVTQAYAGIPWSQAKYTSTRDIWFSGRFRFWIPEELRKPPKGWNSTEFQLYAAMAGLSLSPQVVYRAIPWSWLIDWFGNLGDNIANLDIGVAERFVADYAYLMEHVVNQNENTLHISLRDAKGEQGSVVTASSRIFSELKIRERASPFGFSLKSSDFSPFQLGIIGSLGLSKWT